MRGQQHILSNGTQGDGFAMAGEARGELPDVGCGKPFTRMCSFPNSPSSLSTLLSFHLTVSPARTTDAKGKAKRELSEIADVSTCSKEQVRGQKSRRVEGDKLQALLARFEKEYPKYQGFHPVIDYLTPTQNALLNDACDAGYKAGDKAGKGKAQSTRTRARNKLRTLNIAGALATRQGSVLQLAGMI
jgi:hypothetical protein